jgi:hypothetical protein
MGRLRAISTVCALALVAALVLAACGGGGADLLPGQTAEQINRNLDQVRNFVAEGDCAGAEAAVSEVSEEVDGLGNVDKKLKAALREGTSRLGVVVSSCGEEALEEAEGQEAAEQEAEQQEQEGFEAEEEELAEQKEEQSEEKAQEKSEKEAEKEQQASEKEAEKEEVEPPSGEGPKGPPAETPSGNEPPAGGVGPGTETE